MNEATVLNPEEGRFARLQAIDWWQHERLAAATAFVVGAGALGNEVLKNLALLGIGHVVVVDRDQVETSNLCRSVLFRPGDEGRDKVAAAADGMRGVFPEMRITAINGNLLADIGLGWIRNADVVIGALDNRETRVFLNQVCAQMGKAWFDGGLDVLSGIVRGFDAAKGACYECTMGKADWDQLDRRNSCSLVARRAAAQRGVPTTPTIASIIGGILVQEVVKQLHGLDALIGRALFFEGGLHQGYTVEYPVSDQCPWHEEQVPVAVAEALSSDNSLAELRAWASQKLGEKATSIDFPRAMCRDLACPACDNRRARFAAIEGLEPQDVICDCGSEMVPTPFTSLCENDGCEEHSLRELGLPRWDVVWARAGGKSIAIEIAGDRPEEQQT